MYLKIYRRVVLLCGLSVLALLLSALGNLVQRTPDMTLASCFLQSFGGVKPDRSALLQIIIFQIPWILFLYAYALFFRYDFEIDYVYVFPRVGTKRRWLFKKTVSLFFHIAVAWGSLFLLTAAVAVAVRVPISGGFRLYAQLYLTNVLALFVLAFAQNLLSLLIGSTQSFLVELFLYILAIIFAVYTYGSGLWNGWFLALLPTAGQMLLWHTDAAVSASVRAGFYPASPYFLLWQSWLVMLAGFVVLYGLLYSMIEKRDLMGFVKEEDS